MINVFKPKLTLKNIVSVFIALLKNEISGTSQVVKEFENNLAKQFDRNYSVAVSNGSTALEVAWPFPSAHLLDRLQSRKELHLHLWDQDQLTDYSTQVPYYYPQGVGHRYGPSQSSTYSSQHLKPLELPSSSAHG